MSVYDGIKLEREEQVKQWGGAAHDDAHPPEDWLSFIKKQMEAADALIGAHVEQSDDKFRTRMVKIAALSVACAESLDRHHEIPVSPCDAEVERDAARTEIGRLRSVLTAASRDLAGGDRRAEMVRTAIDLAIAAVPS
jgi:hypothetical protein